MIKYIVQNISMVFVFFICIGFSGALTYGLLNVLGQFVDQPRYTVKYKLPPQKPAKVATQEDPLKDSSS